MRLAESESPRYLSLIRAAGAAPGPGCGGCEGLCGGELYAEVGVVVVELDLPREARRG